MNFSLSARIAHLTRGYRLATLALVLPMVLLLAACGGDAEVPVDSEATAFDRTLPVEVIVAEASTFEDVIEMTGTIEAPDDATLSAEASGTLTALAPLGTTIRRGGTVAQINATMGQAGVAQAQASLEAAQAQAALAEDRYRREEPLLQDSIISAMEFESVRTQRAAARAQVAQARAALAQAQQQLAYTRVTAPFTGTVEERFAERGEQVAPGVPVVRLVSTEQVKVQAGVPERYAGDIEVGTPVRIVPQAYNVPPMRGTVTFVGRAINPQNRTFPIEVGLPNEAGQLKPEMIVRLEVQRQQFENVITLPLAAIVRDERGTSVLVVREEGDGLVAQRQPTELGAQSGGYVVVTSGVEPGDRVIASGQSTVSEGDRVRISDELPSGFAPVSLAD
ncbi:MAG: efflux RND transporter periplasmic adaptor subunit [Rhodothermales bacterium]